MLELSVTTSLIIILSFFILHWYSSLFMQSFFHHRYAAHMQFTTTKLWEKVFFILSFITQGASYLSPRAYGIMHRLHHAHTDTEKDPHSPKYSSNVYSMMWKTKIMYNEIFQGKTKIHEKYLVNLPEWNFIDRIGHKRITRILWILAYVLFYVFFATQWWMYLILPLHVAIAPIQGAVINWFAHKIGYKNHTMSNTSTNLINMDLLMWGESLHNNHHKNPSSANFANKKFEFDPMYVFIRLFGRLGIIELKRTPAQGNPVTPQSPPEIKL